MEDSVEDCKEIFLSVSQKWVGASVCEVTGAEPLRPLQAASGGPVLPAAALRGGVGSEASSGGELCRCRVTLELPVSEATPPKEWVTFCSAAAVEEAPLGV